METNRDLNANDIEPAAESSPGIIEIPLQHFRINHIPRTRGEIGINCSKRIEYTKEPAERYQINKENYGKEDLDKHVKKSKCPFCQYSFVESQQG